MKKIANFCLLLITLNSTAQTALLIPDTLSGTTINLTIADSSKQFFAGYTTSTIAYNGIYLGPTVILNKGQSVTMNVNNLLTDTTTTHWHGLHVSPMNDGSPHNPIMPSTVWSPTFNVMDNAATYWYHPHLHGKTMDQVLMGAAGLIIVRDSTEATLTLPRKYGIDDFPIILQFQTFDTTTKQLVMDDEFDNTVLVNGLATTPFLDVPAQVVRLRIVNASSHRFFKIGFDDNRTFKQITTDDGLLNAPVSMTNLMLGSGERAEILVDFTGQSGNTFYIKQYGTLLPAGYPGGPLGGMGGTLGPLDNIDFNILQLNVVAPTTSPVTTIPATLTTNTVYSAVGAANFNVLIQGSPMMSMTNFVMNAVQFDDNVINMTTTQNTIMKWTITNQSMMPHPFHIHGNHFYVLSVNGTTAPLNMQGRKDVVVVSQQGGTVELITQYLDFADTVMPYMYHCHILSHEDNGMMGQFIINPTTSGFMENSGDDNNITFFPNPVTDELAVLLGKGNTERKTITIYNTLGKAIFTTTTTENKLSISVSEYAPGMFLLSANYESGNMVQLKFIKQ